MGVYLFKKSVCLLLVLLTFSLNANATIFLVEPFERTLGNNDFIDLGKISRGETLKVVVQRKTGFPFLWDRLTVEQLPQGWNTEFLSTDKTLVALIELPRNAEESIQKISFAVESDSSPFSRENFSAYLSVKENLLRASMEGLKQRAMVGEEAVFHLLLNNESIAEQKIVVSSTLPDYWFKPREITIPPRKTLDLNLSVFPQSYGVKRFSFTVASQLNDFEQSFQSELSVFSTLKGKFCSALYGFPFFIPSLFPHFIINAFLALLS